MPRKPKRQYTMPGSFDAEESDSIGGSDTSLSDTHAGSILNDSDGRHSRTGIEKPLLKPNLQPQLPVATNDSSGSVQLKKSTEKLETVCMNSSFWRPESTPPASFKRSLISDKTVWTPWSNKYIRPQDAAKFEAIRLHKIDTWTTRISVGTDDLVGNTTVYVAETNETYGDYQYFNSLPITPIRLAFACYDSTTLKEWKAARKCLLEESSKKRTFLPSILLKVFARHTHPDRIISYKRSLLSALNLQLPSQCISAEPQAKKKSLQKLKKSRPLAEYIITLLQTLSKAKTASAQWLFLDLIEGHTSATSANMASLLSLHEQYELQNNISRFCELTDSIAKQVSEKQTDLLEIQQMEISKNPPATILEQNVAKVKDTLRRVLEAFAFSWILRNGLSTLGEHHAVRIQPKVAKFVYDNFLALRPQGRFFNFELKGVEESVAEERAKTSSFRPPSWMPEDIHMAWAEIVRSVAWREGKLRD